MAVHNGRIRSFKALFSSDVLGEVHSEAKSFAITRQLDRFEKKYEVDDPCLEARAIQGFLDANELAGKTQISIDSDIKLRARAFIADALCKFTSDYVSDPQCVLDVGLLLSLWKFGPGASQGSKYTHFCDKISQRSWTCTDRSKRYVELLRYTNPYLRANDSSGNWEGLKIVNGSRMSTVPKNADTNRTICTEPLGNMAMQLAAGLYIEGALRRTGCDLSTQPDQNKYLAWVGSRDRSLATMDLKSASDLITPSLIRELWPAEWFHLLCALRSEVTELPDGTMVRLNMLSTMGNGFTFPVMTLTLRALLFGVCGEYHDGSFDYERYAVFGDDIILPTELYEIFSDVLAGAGLIVNLDKSYAHDSDFRESCGGDYYKGYDVTPFYVKSLTGPQALYTACNQLLLWCSRHEIRAYDTLNLLVAWIEETEEIKRVPEWHDAFAGIRVLSCPKRYKYYDVAVQQTNRRFNDPVLMLAVLGGYCSPGGDNRILYTRRPKGKPKYEVQNGRMLKSIPEGYDPKLGSYDKARWRDHMVWIATYKS